jgi:hypothetical protein
MSTTRPEPAAGSPAPGLEQYAGIDGMVAASTPGQAAPIERRMIYAQGGNLRHVRHAQLLDRWPILAEPWARRVEEGRLAAVDRTPGAATFGR